MKKTGLPQACFHMCAIVDAIGTRIRAHNGYIYIPDLCEKAGVLVE